MKTHLGMSRTARSGVALVGAVALLFTASACGSDAEEAADDTQTSQTPEPSVEPTPSETAAPPVQSVIVKFVEGESPGNARPERRAFFVDVLTKHGLKAQKISLSLTDTYVINLDKELSGEELQGLLADLSQLNGVEYAQPNSMASTNEG